MRPPEFWNHRHGRDAAPMIRTLLRPIAWIYAKAVRRRFATTESYDVGIPVICVGNATMGGTGKTPIVIYLLQSLRRMQLNAVGLTRGYGGQQKGPIPVHPRHTAQDVGDEPLLLARHGPVWVAEGRDDGARAARSHGAQIIVMDDGHQNPQLTKTLSLMVVDAETGFGNGCVFPAGPLREPLSDALERADAIILMKPTPEYEIETHLAVQLKGKKVIPAYLAPQAEPPRGKLYAFAGIGRPNKFFAIITPIMTRILKACFYWPANMKPRSSRLKKIMFACLKGTAKACMLGPSKSYSKTSCLCGNYYIPLFAPFNKACLNPAIYPFDKN